MRKVLLTVMMVSSLLAFNACKKDGAQGPAGPAGPTGAAGAAGAVGAAGAKGADGTKILSKAGAPVAAEGVAGDYSFDTTTKTLWGPKTATGWPATGTALTGANGATGATGANGATGAVGATGATGAAGTRFLAGPAAPTAADGSTGDFYFDTTTSTFYGPKLADGTWSSSMPLGQAYAAKTFNITKGFENVTLAAGTKNFGVDLYAEYDQYNQNTSYAVTANDLIRINAYPQVLGADGNLRGGWAENREMAFETTPGTNVFGDVATAASQLGSSTAEGISTTRGDANKQVGARFRYSKNTANPLATFTLTQDDIDRLKVSAGAAYGYLTYGNVKPGTYGLGQNLIIADRKTVIAKTSTVNYSATYTARTVIDLNNIPGLGNKIEKYKQDGKVFLKYRYYDVNTTATSNNNLINHAGDANGWADITNYINSYAAVSPTTTAFTTPGTTDQNPFILTTGVKAFNAAIVHPGSAGLFGVIGTTITLEPNQVATVANVTTGPVAFRTQNLDGYVVINWSLATGTGVAAAPTYIGPDQIQNGGNVTDPVTVATANPFGPAPASASYIQRTTSLPYYSTDPSLVNRTLFAKDGAGTALTIAAGDMLSVPTFKGGKPESYFTNTKLVKIQVFVVPGDVVKELKAKGVDTNNPNAISANIKL